MSSRSQDGDTSGLGDTPSSNPTLNSPNIPPQLPAQPAQGKILYAKFNDTPKDEQPTTQPARYVDLAEKVDFQGLLKVHERPCGREGLLAGIGGGAAVGGIRFVFGAPIPKAANWAVGTFLLGSIASYEYCKYNKRLEHIRVKRILEVYNTEQKEKIRKAEEMNHRKREEERLAEEKKRRWYRLW